MHLHDNCESNSNTLRELKEFALCLNFDEWDLNIILSTCYAAMGHNGYKARVISLDILSEFIKHRKSKIKKLGFPKSITGYLFNINANDSKFYANACPSILKLERAYKKLHDYPVRAYTGYEIHNKIFEQGYIHSLLGITFDKRYKD